MSVKGTTYLDKNLCSGNDVVCNPTVVTCEFSVPFNPVVSVVNSVSYYSSVSSDCRHLQRPTSERMRKARLQDSALGVFISYPERARP
jgi:hypothetical protein